MAKKRRKLVQGGDPRVKPRKPLKKTRGEKAHAKTQPKGQPDKKKKMKKQPTRPQQNQRPTIPFAPGEAILLVGEGDLSFARSLVEHHGCTDVTVTVLEKNLAELTAKYPHVPDNVAAITASGPNNKVLFGVDARTMTVFRRKRTGGGPEGGGVTGTKDRILFNFPHVGGKSTDVNRQVRYNQELLVDFFGRAAASLAPGGSIVVTLFEGEPYTLWNVRDLARHAGLQVERSFAFRADAYPGYRHARTLGAIRNRDGELTGGRWRGEDRPARSYVFFRKGEVPRPPVSKREKKRKRSASDALSPSSSSSSSSDDDGENVVVIDDDNSGGDSGGHGDEGSEDE